MVKLSSVTDRTVMPPRSVVMGPTRRAQDPPVVALTIDAEHPDGPGLAPANGERMLAALEEAAVRATFFLQGRWVTAYPGLARAIVQAGHLVGSHSHYHAPMPLLTRAGLREDVLQAQAAITAVTGVDPRPWFRSPFGIGVGHRSLDDMLHELGYVNVPWHVDGADWEATQSPGAIADAIVGGCLRGQKPRIVLLHSWPEAAAIALPEILTRLAEVATAFVTVDAIPPPTNYPAVAAEPLAHFAGDTGRSLGR